MQAGGRNIAPEFIFGWFVQLARAVAYLHQQRVVHRDIKASNIFFYGPKLLKLGDLGLAGVVAWVWGSELRVWGAGIGVRGL